MNKKYYISECLMIKNENQYLHEHIVSDMEAGIDHFYIYDDESDVPVKEYLKNNYPELLEFCTITVVTKESGIADLLGNKQISCYRHALLTFGGETVWMSYTDTDEIYEGDLKKYLKEREDRHSVFIPWILHGSNGHIFMNDKTLKENYYDSVIKLDDFRRLKGINYFDFMFLGKTISQCDKLKELNLYSDVHITLPLSEIENYNRWELNETEFDYWTLPVKEVVVEEKEPEIKLHHYFYRSFEELLKKKARGYTHLIEKKSKPRNGNTKEGVEKWADRDWLDFDKYFDLNPDVKYDNEGVSELFYQYGINHKAYYKQKPAIITHSFLQSNPKSPEAEKHRLIIAKLNRRR
jgi:hypothetical protein